MTRADDLYALAREEQRHLAQLRRPGGFSAWARLHLGVDIDVATGDVLGAFHAAGMEAGIARRNHDLTRQTRPKENRT